MSLEPIKQHPGCKDCQCYPEGRNDCPNFTACRVRLGYAASEGEAALHEVEAWKRRTKAAEDKVKNLQSSICYRIARFIGPGRKTPA